jgi:hypothetical protein
MPTKPRLITTASAILIVAVLAIVSAVTKAQASQNNTQVIMNLLNGQQYFGVPHVYLGDDNGAPSCLTTSEELLVTYSCWPVYYGPNNASQYWSQGNITSDQPVLDIHCTYSPLVCMVH